MMVGGPGHRGRHGHSHREAAEAVARRRRVLVAAFVVGILFVYYFFAPVPGRGLAVHEQQPNEQTLRPIIDTSGTAKQLQRQQEEQLEQIREQAQKEQEQPSTIIPDPHQGAIKPGGGFGTETSEKLEDVVGGKTSSLPTSREETGSGRFQQKPSEADDIEGLSTEDNEKEDKEVSSSKGGVATGTASTGEDDDDEDDEESSSSTTLPSTSSEGSSANSQLGSKVQGKGARRLPTTLRPKMPRVLVSGGAGFVGSHLVDRLLERGCQVIVLDNYFTGRKENVLHHVHNPNFELVRHDVVEPYLAEVDQIYSLASPASPVHYKYNPVKTVKTNVIGTINMLGLAKRVGARFFLASTSEVYGDPLQHPQQETYWGNVNPIGTRSCYDEGKRVAETLAFDYHRGLGVEIRIIRIFNTYGPRMALNDGRVVSNFVSQAIRKEPMTIMGDGKQTRSFQYVSDLVAGMMAIMDNDEHTGPFNIGNPGEFTMNELAEVVKEIVDPDARVTYIPNTEDDPHKRKPDITKAKTLLGWEPKVSLREGLPLMVEDFRKRVEVKASA